jgi:hypothetical protein
MSPGIFTEGTILADLVAGKLFLFDGRVLAPRSNRLTESNLTCLIGYTVPSPAKNHLDHFLDLVISHHSGG